MAHVVQLIFAKEKELLQIRCILVRIFLSLELSLNFDLINSIKLLIELLLIVSKT